MTYSLDLRERVIAYIEQGGRKVEASILFQVSRPTIDKWIEQKKETGTLEIPPIPARKWRKLNPEELISYVKENPNKSQMDYAKHFGVTDSGLWRALNRINYTFKKRPRSIKNEMKKEEKNT